MIKNLNSLLKLAAGHSYKVLDVTDTVVSVLHRKCGNEFTSTVTDIAKLSCRQDTIFLAALNLLMSRLR